METTNKKLTAAGGFLKQGSILAVASILVRMIGLLYRIPMANIIGPEGNGIYSSAYEIYNILLIISSYGMPMAVSKMVSAKCVEKRYKEAYHIFRCSMIFSLCTGGAAALFVFFGADWLEKNFFKSFYDPASDSGTDYICSGYYGYTPWFVPGKKDDDADSDLPDL